MIARGKIQLRDLVVVAVAAAAGRRRRRRSSSNSSSSSSSSSICSSSSSNSCSNSCRSGSSSSRCHPGAASNSCRRRRPVPGGRSGCTPIANSAIRCDDGTADPYQEISVGCPSSDSQNDLWMPFLRLPPMLRRVWGNVFQPALSANLGLYFSPLATATYLGFWRGAGTNWRPDRPHDAHDLGELQGHWGSIYAFIYIRALLALVLHDKVSGRTALCGLAGPNR